MSHPLSDVTTQALAARLRQRHDQLLAELGQAQAHILQATQAEPRDVLDQKDLADSTEHALVRDAEANRDHDELVQVRAALERLAQHRYGRCQECDEPIALARLEAFPAALRCLACQTALEAARR